MTNSVSTSMRMPLKWSDSSFMNTGPRPVNGEPARRTALRGMARLLEVARIDLFEARLQVGQARQRPAGRHDALRRHGTHVAIGDHAPAASSVLLGPFRHDALHAFDAKQHGRDVGAVGLDPDGM